MARGDSKKRTRANDGAKRGGGGGGGGAKQNAGNNGTGNNNKNRRGGGRNNQGPGVSKNQLKKLVKKERRHQDKSQRLFNNSDADGQANHRDPFFPKGRERQDPESLLPHQLPRVSAASRIQALLRDLGPVPLWRDPARNFGRPLYGESEPVQTILKDPRGDGDIVLLDHNHPAYDTAAAAAIAAADAEAKRVKQQQGPFGINASTSLGFVTSRRAAHLRENPIDLSSFDPADTEFFNLTRPTRPPLFPRAPSPPPLAQHTPGSITKDHFRFNNPLGVQLLVSRQFPELGPAPEPELQQLEDPRIKYLREWQNEWHKNSLFTPERLRPANIFQPLPRIVHPFVPQYEQIRQAQSQARDIDLPDAVDPLPISLPVSQTDIAVPLVQQQLLFPVAQSSFPVSQSSLPVSQHQPITQVPSPSPPPSPPSPLTSPTSSVMPPKSAQPSSLLPEFLKIINLTVFKQHALQLKSILPIEPPYSQDYVNLINQIKHHDDKHLNSLITAFTKPQDWIAFPNFLTTYLRFICTVNPNNLLETFEKLANLIAKTTSAFQSAQHGHVLLPTILDFCKVLARLAIGLDKQPSLIAHLLNADEAGTTTSLAKKVVILLRPIISDCVMDSTPDGKSTAVYKLANICMKVLFQCNKVELVRDIFVAVSKAPVSDYSRADRVTYCYYLGRSLYACAQFFAASRVLDQAYMECDPAATKNRRSILIYLIAASLLLGRFPTAHLYARPEAAGLEDRFAPICRVMKLGDLCTFRRLTALETAHAPWFLRYNILLQTQDRGEVIVWRSLARRAFALRSPPEHEAISATNAQGRPLAKTLDLRDFYVVMRALAIRALVEDGNETYGDDENLQLLEPYIDPEFEGLSYEELGFDHDNAFLPIDVPTESEVEGMVASMITMGLMRGYISHKSYKFAIKGARDRSALQSGWPPVTESLRELHGNDPIPGFNNSVDQESMVIHMSSALPAGF